MADGAAAPQVEAGRIDGALSLGLAFAIAHQIDAAYWREWEMFGLPGGIQLNLLMNLALFLPLLAAARRVYARTRHARACALGIAAAVGLILPIHLGFALAGERSFALPVSIAVILGTGAAALALALAARRLPRAAASR